MNPVWDARANAGPSRLAAGTGSVPVTAVAEGRRVELQRRAQVLVLELEEHRSGRPPAEAHALEEGMSAGAESRAELVREAHLQPHRRLELVAEARHLQALGAAAEPAPH